MSPIDTEAISIRPLSQNDNLLDAEQACLFK
jgi:hypothetical protein